MKENVLNANEAVAISGITFKLASFKYFTSSLEFYSTLIVID